MSKKEYCKWDLDEVKKLFSFVENTKQNHMPLSKAFYEYALLTGRKPNSVRNYYYLELKELESNKARKDKLGIDLSKHKKQNFKSFTNEETHRLTYTILQNQRKGKSVRSTCLELANNDVNKMIRYQNKFRSVLKTNKDLVARINKQLDAVFGPIKSQTQKNNILTFPKIKENKPKLTDEELKSLFMGIVKLVKKSADYETSAILKKECNFANENLRKALVAVRKKEEEILNLTSENKNLTKKVKLLEEQIIKLRVNLLKEVQTQSKKPS